MDEPTPRTGPSVKQLSKTPSWIMLGFVLGAAFVLALPRKPPPPPPARPIVVAAPAEPQRPPEPPQLTTIEAVFAEWDQYAVWSNDVTQVALWNSSVGDFAEYYEVRRDGEAYWFRSLPQLTNRVIRHGKMPPSECPLRFTETEEQYREWREHGRYERPADVVRPAMQRVAPERPALQVETSPLQVAPEKPKIERPTP